MTATSAEFRALPNAGPDLHSVTSPQPTMPQRMVFMQSAPKISNSQNTRIARPVPRHRIALPGVEVEEVVRQWRFSLKIKTNPPDESLGREGHGFVPSRDANVPWCRCGPAQVFEERRDQSIPRRHSPVLR